MSALLNSRSSSPSPQLPSSSDPPSSPTGNSDNSPRRDSGYWKRQYLALRDEQVNTSKKRKSSPTSTSQLGRGIRRIVFLLGDISELIEQSDLHSLCMEDDTQVSGQFEGLDDDEIMTLKRTWERSHTGLKELFRLIPNFKMKIDNGSPEELASFYASLQRGANDARSEDLNRIRCYFANWMNQSNPPPSPLFHVDDRRNRGLEHDVTGELLCPIHLDWKNEETRLKVRNGEEGFEWHHSPLARCFYSGFMGDPANVEKGYLKSALLVKVYKCIFTSPSSANDTPIYSIDDAENVGPPSKIRKTRGGQCKNVAAKLHMSDKVTPRSIAYAAVQLHFTLQTATAWTEEYNSFSYRALYEFIIDYFEEAKDEAKDRSNELLKWWSLQIFPNSPSRPSSNMMDVRKALKAQRAALANIPSQ